MSATYYCSKCTMEFDENSVIKTPGGIGTNAVCPICKEPLRKKVDVSSYEGSKASMCVIPVLVLAGIVGVLVWLGMSGRLSGFFKDMSSTRGYQEKQSSEQSFSSPLAYANNYLDFSQFSLGIKPKGGDSGDTQSVILQGRIKNWGQKSIKNVVIRWEYNLYGKTRNGTYSLGSFRPGEQRDFDDFLHKVEVRLSTAFNYKITIESASVK